MVYGYAPFHNTGTVLVQGGNLYVGNGGTSTGDFSVGGGTRLTFGGTHILSGEIVGEGSVAFYGGEALVAGRYDVGEGTDVELATVEFTYPQDTTRVGKTLHVAGKAMFHDTSISTDELYVSGELSVSSGTVQVNRRLQWQGGTMSGAGETIVATDATLEIHGGKLAGRTLTNRGEATWNDPVPWQQLLLVGQSTFNNEGSLDIDVPEGGERTLAGGDDGDAGLVAGTFNNTGTLTKSGRGALAIGPNWWVNGYVPFNNSGTVVIKEGEAGFGTGYVQTEGRTVLDGGSIGSATPLEIQGGSLTGVGVISGSVLNGGRLSPGGIPAESPLGSIQIGADYSQTSTGALDVDLGGPAASQFDQLDVTGRVTLGGALNVGVLGSFRPSLGDTLTIIDNKGTEAVDGTFARLDEGAKLTAGDYEFTITYRGRDENDIVDGNNVVLTVTNVVSANSVLSGSVWVDFNNDGLVDFGEKGIAGASIQLLNTRGEVVDQVFTDSDGDYNFLGLRPGEYSIAEGTVPAGYVHGKAAAGTAGGVYDPVDRAFQEIELGKDQLGVCYNFGERPTPGSAETKGQSATIGFWQNKNGQALIKSFGGGANSTVLSNWLAATLPNVFGERAGANNLAGRTNTEVAAAYQQRFVVKGMKLDAQLMATALSVFATSSWLGGASATSYGFHVSQYGLGNSTYNIGTSGAAFGVANNSVMTVMDILLYADQQAVNGVLYNGNTKLRTMANSVFDGINTLGDIG